MKRDRLYCRNCGYEYATKEAEKRGRCLCPPDFGTERELEPSAGRMGDGIGRGDGCRTTDYGRPE
jgi:hypothetical protein